MASRIVRLVRHSQIELRMSCSLGKYMQCILVDENENRPRKHECVVLYNVTRLWLSGDRQWHTLRMPDLGTEPILDELRSVFILWTLTVFVPTRASSDRFGSFLLCTQWSFVSRVSHHTSRRSTYSINASIVLSGTNISNSIERGTRGPIICLVRKR